ncbi:probable polygalacturonase At3g15720 [Vigna unguiculata]|uniref:probable polygalacturonase At3g15720 n=1 Tax=Vigna unguiculata TaxID=3917 RepID=UPI001016E5F7|nr:probable polygalacturonase At3g15720 [Vigna unguiculata]
MFGRSLVGTQIPFYNVVNYGARGDGKSDDSQAFLSAWKDTCGSEGIPTLIIPRNGVFKVKNINLSGPCRATKIHIKVISFEQCNGLRVHYLSIIDSPRAHVTVDGCNNAFFSHIYIRAPADSPNTDGFDISASKYITIKDSIVATGDDCIAINGGSSFINATGIACGPGHGISVGSLGRNGEVDTVEEVYVSNCSFTNTQNGARIKTWQGGSGFARKIIFEKITLRNCFNPIIINQNYEYDGLEDSVVKVSDVTFRGFKGTSGDDRTIDMSCASSGCFNIVLEDINIVSSEPGKPASCSCNNAHGITASTTPNCDCLLK